MDQKKLIHRSLNVVLLIALCIAIYRMYQGCGEDWDCHNMAQIVLLLTAAALVVFNVAYWCCFKTESDCNSDDDQDTREVAQAKVARDNGVIRFFAEMAW